ncbi:MAG: hypothetical protein K2X43_16170 [Hyphomonadaceae bacterium]|nr:hypothetical protein [Hyphomonadaceae bacterium]
MLKARGARAAAAPPTEIAERRLWHDERRYTPCLGCWACPERKVCGTLAVAAGITSCLDLCCGSPSSCDKPCRNHPDYALRVREIGGFDLVDVPQAPVLAAPDLPASVPVIFHGDSRAVLIGPAPVALPLYRMFRRRTGELRFGTHEELCDEFGLVPGTPIVLTGTDQDPPLERWWGLESRRREIVGALPALGVVMSTTPNFSLFGDVPRHVDLHAIKRIGLVHAEFLQGGLPCALHVNGRTDTDFRNWGEYVRERPEVTHLAYEFTTGTARVARRDYHLENLIDVTAAAGRPLGLLVRGGIEVLPRLRAAFATVTVLETMTFFKTMMRQRIVLREDGTARWRSAPTPLGAPIDPLFAVNRAGVQSWIEGPLSPAPVTAEG